MLLILWPVFQAKNQVPSSFISAKDQLTNILKATGQKFDEAEITKVVDSLKGKKLEEVIHSYKFSWSRKEQARLDQAQDQAPQLRLKSQQRNNNQRRKLKRKSQRLLKKKTISVEPIFSDDPYDLCPFI